MPAGPGAAGVPLGPRQEKKKKIFPQAKSCLLQHRFPAPSASPQDPKIPSQNSQGATWSGAAPRRVLVAPPLPARGQVLRSWGTGRHRGRPTRPPGSAAKLTSLLLLRLQADGDVLLPARHGVCSLGLLRGSLAPWSPAAGLAAPPGSRPPAGRNTPGAAQRGWGAEATPRHMEPTPSAPLLASKSPELPGVAVAVAGGRARPRATRAEREGREEGVCSRGGAVWPRGRGTRAGRCRTAEPPEVGAGGSSGLAPPRSAPPPPRLLLPLPRPSAASRWDSEPPRPHKAPQGGRDRAAGSRGACRRSLSPETRARLGEHGGARALTPSTPRPPACEARPARQVRRLAPRRGCGALARPSRASRPKPDRPLRRFRR